MSKEIPHSDPYWPGPKLNVKQLGRRCGEDHLPGYEGCWELREFVSGVDYANPDSDGLLMGCVARRNADRRIFAAPDWRFCSRQDVFEVLWLQERRRKNVVPAENHPAS